jgi:hypothetical protein
MMSPASGQYGSDDFVSDRPTSGDLAMQVLRGHAGEELIKRIASHLNRRQNDLTILDRKINMRACDVSLPMSDQDEFA